MVVLAKRNLVIPAPDGSDRVKLARGIVADVPDWAAQTAYFSALVADGKIVPTRKSDKATQAAAEKPVKVRRGKAQE